MVLPRRSLLRYRSQQFCKFSSLPLFHEALLTILQTILTAIGFSGGDNVYLYYKNVAIGNIILVCAGAIPGYWVTVATVDTIGRKPIQLMGFTLLTIFFCIMGFGYHVIGTNGLFAVYVLAYFFFNFGPNATTFIVPGECFPTRYRSTSHGISAASGKVGAIIAQVLIGPLEVRGATEENPDPWLNHVLEIFALFMLCGIFTSLLIPETKRKTLEQLAGEVPGTPEYDPALNVHSGHGAEVGGESSERSGSPEGKNGQEKV